MSATVTLCTSQETFEELHKIGEGRGTYARFDKQLLARLLIDHSRMYNALRSNGVAVKFEEQGQ